MLDPRKIEFPSRTTYKLDFVREIAQDFDNPQLGRRTILVGGTNGKGSTVTYLTDLYRRLGLKTGTYISPHVVSRCERILINGKPISEKLLKSYEWKYGAFIQHLSYFEKFTILAFLIFRELKVDIQILEVGLGGRLDATNISEPDISAISRVDYDHQEILGDSLTQIAAEKSGIMRKQRPIVVGSQSAEVIKVLRNAAKDLGALFFRSNFVRLEARILKKIVQERGLHQVENIRLAVSVFEKSLEFWPELEKFRSISRGPKWNAFMKGLLVAPLPPARIQRLKAKGLWIVDGSHNENSIEALIRFLRQNHAGMKFRMIFGAMKDKEIENMLRLLKPWASEIYFPSFYSEREIPPLDLVPMAKKLGFKMIYATDSLSQLIKDFRAQKAPVLVVGSLYLAGAVLQKWSRR